MAETYCGKTCASCFHKEKLNCPGCKAGPGARFTGDCKLAKCCVSKGHDACDSCNIKPRCGSYIGRIQAPEHRLKAQKAKLQEQEEIRTRTAGLHRVFYLLFWLVFPGVVGSLLMEDFLANPYPILGTVGVYITFLSGLAYGIVLLSQYRRQREYLIAGVLSVVASILRFASNMKAPPQGEFNYATVIGLAAGVIQLVAIYKEFNAHSEVLVGVDELSDKWLKLWRWFIGTYCAVLGSILVILISPLLGLLVTLAGAVGMTVVEIVKLVYLYHSAQACQEY